MGKPVLLLRLEGPLQSWGVRSRWDVRDTGLEPSKSGVIGLLGCALGLPVRDPRLEELDRGLRFGVRVEHPGVVMTDYHTITDYLPTADGRFRVSGGTLNGPSSKLAAEGHRPATILSPRSYLEDASFLAALEAHDGAERLLERCAEKLQAPQWPLYLGRKACIPTRPIFDPEEDGIKTCYDGIEDALANHPWSWLGAGREDRKPPSGQLTVWIEDAAGEYVRQDAIRTNTSRTYGFRTVRPNHFAPVLKQADVDPSVEEN